AKQLRSGGRMSRTAFATIVSALASTLALANADAAMAQAPGSSPNLRIVAVDVGGGAATLFVTPEGKSLLIDSGWAPGAGSVRLNIKGLPAAPTAAKIVAPPPR